MISSFRIAGPALVRIGASLILATLFAATSSAQTAAPSLAECAARYDNHDRYILEEFPDSPAVLPFDYELRTIAARTRAELNGEPVDWAGAAALSAPASLEWMSDQGPLDRCDETLGLTPTTSGKGMFGYRSSAEITQPDNLACFAMLRVLDQQDSSKDYALRAERALFPLYLVGWTREEITVLASRIYLGFASRYSTSAPQNPSGKLAGAGELNAFARVCARHFEALTVDLSTVPITYFEERCFRERQDGRACSDGFTKLLDPASE